MPSVAAEPALGMPLDEAADKYLLYLDHRNRSPNTLRSYAGALRGLQEFLQRQGMPTDIEGVRREHLEAYLDSVKKLGASPATLAQRLAIIKAFFRFLVLEDDLQRSPADRIGSIAQPQRLVQMLSDDDLRQLRRACAGSTFADRRALAILELAYDTGLRRQELADLTWSDVDLKSRVVRVRHGKGDKERLSRFRRDTGLVLYRYKTARREYLRKNGRPDLPWLWIGHRGQLTDAGIEEAMKARARTAGVSEFHLHKLRHGFAHRAKAAGMSDESIMALGGWASHRIMSNYGRSGQQMRALDEYDRVMEE